MSMDHYFDFFDRKVFDPVWALSWQGFQREYGSRWCKRKGYNPDVDSDTSLRELICFSLEPQPSPEFLEDVLARRTIRWTIRHSSPQFYLMCSLIHHVPGYRASYCCVEDRDMDGLISVAAGAYIAEKIDGHTLRAVLKICRSDPQEWLRLSRAQKAALATATSDIEYWKPLYAWQGADALLEDDCCSSCLNAPDTRRFLKCMSRAWSENWPVLPLADHHGNETHFRDFPIARELWKAVSKVRRFKKPSVWRMWT